MLGIFLNDLYELSHFSQLSSDLCIIILSLFSFYRKVIGLGQLNKFPSITQLVNGTVKC